MHIYIYIFPEKEHFLSMIPKPSCMPTASLPGGNPSHRRLRSVLDIALNHLIVRLQSWNVGE